MDPTNPFATLCLAYYHLLLHEAGPAQELLESVVGLAPGSLVAEIARFLEPMTRGERLPGPVMTPPRLEAAGSRDGQVACFLTIRHVRVSPRDEGLKWIRRTIGLGSFKSAPYWRKVAAGSSLDGDPEFEALMVDLERQAEAFEV
jgi:hypothetical protein